MTLTYLNAHVIPAALSLLPGRMDSLPARAMLFAIGLQESHFEARVQGGGGPAHGFWQFERNGGVKGVLTHPDTKVMIGPALYTLCYAPLDLLKAELNVSECYQAITNNDVLACVFARLLLWSVPGALPARNEPQKGWNQYLAGWRPGKPHRQTWDQNYLEGWRTVTED